MVQEGITRRAAIGGGAGLIGAALLAACSSGKSSGASQGGQPSGTIKFWDMAWGTPSYIKQGTNLVAGFKQGSLRATYQSIGWSNWYQTFVSALSSQTGPAVSTGASTQAYQFYDSGQILSCDSLYSTMQKNGSIADFYSSAFPILHYKGTLVAMPWSYDVRVLWYRKSLLEKAGADVPTNWDELRATGLKLKKIGASGFGVAPTTNGLNYQQYAALILANGGVMVDNDGNPVVTDQKFVDGTEFCLSLVQDGIVRPGMVSWNSADLYSSFSSGDTALTVSTPGMPTSVTAAAAADLGLMSPLKGPSGTQYAAGSVQSIMMYTNTPTKQGSENFLQWYLDNMKVYWTKNSGVLTVPVRKSITAAIKDTSPFTYKISNEYVPLSTLNQFGNTFSNKTALYDASPALTTWAQDITLNRGTAQQLCQKLQASFEKIRNGS